MAANGPGKRRIDGVGKRRTVDEQRPNANQRGYTYRWSQYAKSFLKRPENALCAICRAAGRITPSTLVDHIIPHRGDRKLFWDKSNHQGLCHSCHGTKTSREDGGYGNRRKESP